jgi:glyoxylase-like metal-dependent hydrolase (beta-lactamase superfamily II)
LVSLEFAKIYTQVLKMTTLTRLDCGTLQGELGMFEEGSTGHVTLPVNAWLLRHPQGTVLFDAGMPSSFTGETDRTKKISEFLEIGFGKENTVESQLIANEQEPDRIDFVVLSHIHFDHVGGLSEVPNATVIIQRKEWVANTKGDQDPDTLHPRKDFDLGHKLMLIDGEHDLFGDGSVVCIPTPGHTVGHQSLKVRLSTGEKVVLASDCCCFARTVDTAVLQSFAFDFDEQLRSLVYLRKCRDDGAMIIPGHDIVVVSKLPKVLGQN